MTLGTRPPGRPALARANLADSEKYVEFLLGTLEYALFPHARRPNFAAVFGIHNRDVARNWVCEKIKTN